MFFCTGVWGLTAAVMKLILVISEKIQYVIKAYTITDQRRIYHDQQHSICETVYKTYLNIQNHCDKAKECV